MNNTCDRTIQMFKVDRAGAAQGWLRSGCIPRAAQATAGIRWPHLVYRKTYKRNERAWKSHGTGSRPADRSVCASNLCSYSGLLANLSHPLGILPKKKTLAPLMRVSSLDAKPQGAHTNCVWTEQIHLQHVLLLQSNCSLTSGTCFKI